MTNENRYDKSGKDLSEDKNSSSSTHLSRRKILKTFTIAPFAADPLGSAIIHVFSAKEQSSVHVKDDFISLDVIRPLDLLKLRFQFYNCKYQKREQFTFVIKDKVKQPAYLAVTFPSQHTLEQAFLEADNPVNNEPLSLPAKFIRAGVSRLVYELPMDFQGIPLIMEKLLDWSSYKLKVNARARIQLGQLSTMQAASKDVVMKGVKINQNFRYLGDQNLANRTLNLAENPKYKIQESHKYDKANLQMVIPTDEMLTIEEQPLNIAARKVQLNIAPPGELETAIEAPTRLIISPNQLNDFTHIRQPNTDKIIQYPYPKGDPNSFAVSDPLNTNSGNIVELWHTRMGVKLKNGFINENEYNSLKTIRALWSSDYGSPGIEQPFRASLDSRDRYLLVRETSDYGIKGYTPKPVQAKKLMLSTLGSWLDFDGNFDFPDREGKGLELLKWQHRSTMGRDHFVKVVLAGFLYPFGHKASLVKITERKVDSGTKVAVNRKRYFVVVMEKEKLYAPRDSKNDFIPFPFQAVEVLTDATPNLDHTNSIENLSTEAPKTKYDESQQQIPVYNFWMEVGGKPFLFDLLATDKEGQTTFLRLPMIFISESGAFNANAVNKINTKYNNAIDRITSTTHGQVVAYAESLVEGDTNFITQSIRFGCNAANQGKNNTIKFHPVMQLASVMVKAVEELTGDKSPVDIKLHDDQNEAGLFAELITGKMLDFNGSADKSGGMMNPNAGISALSRLQGPVGGKVNDMAKLDFNPTEFFNDNASLGGVAKLFGVIPIFELLFGNINIKNESADLTNTLNGLKGNLENVKGQIEAKKEELENAAAEAKAAIQQQIDQLKNQLDGFRNQLENTLNNAVPKIPGLKMYKTDRAMVVEYKWLPELEKEKSFFSFLTIRMNGDPANSMHVTTKMVRPFDLAQQTEMSIGSGISNFSIEISELLKVNFDFIQFETGTGKKTKVNVGLDQNEAIVFLGPLAFVNKLQDIIPGDGFGEGPYINLQPTGVTAGFELGIPNVEVGLLSIANITLGAYVRLPFTGAPMTLGFNFCRRDNPFLLTISCFGGGGFFLMETSVKGFVMMEAAFEFGAAISFDVGVASGGVSIMGGFYFKMEMVDEMTLIQLTGYIRINGSLSILGIITLSLEFYLALTYIMKAAADSKAGKLFGEATIKVKIEILFFSKSVSVTARRTLKGADADPTFAQMIEEPDWMEYCEAFA
jgi:Sec-independent protein translocase protein TatA